VFGSTLLLGVMQCFPVIIPPGAALLGYLACEMVMTEPAVTERWCDLPHIGANVAGVVGALLVVAVGRWPQARQARQSEASDQAAAPSA
jgi:predicted tellurium resistance membrane protein TerC